MGGYIIGKAMTDCIALHKEFDHMRPIVYSISTSFGPYVLYNLKTHHGRLMNKTIIGINIISIFSTKNRLFKIIAEVLDLYEYYIKEEIIAILILTSSLLKHAENLLTSGITQNIIIHWFEISLQIAVDHIEKIAKVAKLEDIHSWLIRLITTFLGSSSMKGQKNLFTEIAVKAVSTLLSANKTNVEIEKIRIIKKVGGTIEHSCMFSGLIICNDFSHESGIKELRDATILLLSCPLEPKHISTTLKIEMNSFKDFFSLRAIENKYYKKMVRTFNKCKVDIVLSQWGLDDDACFLLKNSGIQSIRWVCAQDLDSLSLFTNANILSSIKLSSLEKVGSSKKISEINIGEVGEKAVLIEGSPVSPVCSILIRGRTQNVISDAENILLNALYVASNIIRSNALVPGGGVSEISVSLAVDQICVNLGGIECCVAKSFSSALDTIYTSLSANCDKYLPKSIFSTTKVPYKSDGQSNEFNLAPSIYSKFQNSDYYELKESKRSQLCISTRLSKMIIKTE